MDKDREVYERCIQEISQKSQKEISMLQRRLIMNLLRKYGKKPGIGMQAAAEIIVALVRTGYLPCTCADAKKLRKKNERLWTLMSLDM